MGRPVDDGRPGVAYGAGGDERFAALLDAQDDIVVVGQAGDGTEAVRLARAETPDVVLMDIRMPELDGLAATRQIAAVLAALAAD